MKPVIRIDFVDFWGDFEKSNNYFWNLLSPHYELVISNDPDFVIYSAYGRQFARYDCIRIFYTGENVRPDFRECDFAFSFDYLDTPRSYRLPLYALYADNAQLTLPKPDPASILRKKTEFCSFIVSNGACEKRNEFFLKLSRYRMVDSAGRFMNNIGRFLGPTKWDKWEFLRRYKFSIVFENASYPGYTTEKLFEPMIVNTMPIYWGNPLVHRDFNTRSFLNYYDFSDEQSLIDRVIELDRDDSLYIEYMSQPWFNGNVLNTFVDPANVVRQFEFIFSHLGRIVPVARTALRVFSVTKGAAIWGAKKLAAVKGRFVRVVGLSSD